MRPRAPRAGVALLAAGTLAFTACGGGGGATTTISDGAGGTRHVVVTSQNGAFDPATIYAQAAPGVVTIRSIFSGGGSSLLGGGGSAAQGSGFVISDDGEIATNAHVVTDAESGGGAPIHEAKEVYVQFADQNQVPARIVGYDPDADVALLRVDPEGLDLHPLDLGTDDQVKIGEPVAAIGSPFGEDRSLSVGVVSATDRSIDSLTDFQINDAIQTDASINPGNSGGPLLDADAHVIGINQQINTTSGGNEGVGFAVPIDLVARSLDGLRGGGNVDYAYLGVKTEPLYPQLADHLDIPADTGAIVSKVVPGGPAEAAGLQDGQQQIRFQGQPYKVGGDVIVAVNGHSIEVPSDLSDIIAGLSPGDTATLRVIRDGETQTVDVKLGARPGG